MIDNIRCDICEYYGHCTEIGSIDASECKKFKGKVIKVANDGDTSMYWDTHGYGIGRLAYHDLILPRTLQITGCEKIILKDKSLDFVFEITKGKIEEFEEIVVNGIKFKRCD